MELSSLQRPEVCPGGQGIINWAVQVSRFKISVSKHEINLWTYYRACNRHTQIWGVARTFAKILPSYHWGVQCGMVGEQLNWVFVFWPPCLWSEDKNGELFELGANWKKGAHLWPVSYISNYQGPDCSEVQSRCCVKEEVRPVLLQSLMSWVMLKHANLLFRSVVLFAESNLRLLA